MYKISYLALEGVALKILPSYHFSIIHTVFCVHFASPSSHRHNVTLHIYNFFFYRSAFARIIGLDKSSSDVAAEGAILNEMLEIVAKRAALRSFDTNATATGATGGTSSSLAQQSHRDTFESDVSRWDFLSLDFGKKEAAGDTIVSATSGLFTGWPFVFCQALCIYACILYYAFSRD